MFFIDDKPVSIVGSFSHLGHQINSESSDDDDIIKRRNYFIGQPNNNVFLNELKDIHLQYTNEQNLENVNSLRVRFHSSLHCGYQRR